MRTFQSWKGLTKDNHIGAIFARKPQQATSLMVRLLAQNYGKSLDNYLQQFPVKYFETDDEYTWEVIGSSRRNIALVEARDIAGTPITSASGNQGVNGAPFYLVFNEDWFADAWC